MKKAISICTVLLLMTVTLFSCGDDYDDSAIKNDINDLKSRVEKLETWCTTANSQITALQGLVEALQANDYITGVTPVMDGTTETGYTITFKKGSPITIMNGKDGVNGSDGINGTTPIIGVAKADDGNYYWTVQTGTAEATWLTDADGNKIRTTGDKGVDGTIGKDGVTPKLSIEKDGDTYYWKVNGEWLLAADGKKVPATGTKGDTGATGSSGSDGAQGPKGDSFFKSVISYPDKGYVEFEPTIGNKFQVPLLSTTVSFDKYEPMQIATTGTATDIIVNLPLTLKKADFAAIKADITNVAGTNTAITRATPEKWDVKLTAPTFENGLLKDQPKVEVTVPTTATEDETALLKITVVDSDGNESTSTRVLYYSTKIAVTGITLTPETLTVKVGKTETLTAAVAPANASNQKVNWTSSDATIAAVAADGTVTGVKAGTATITATTDDGGFAKTCAVTVENITVTGVTLKATATINKGKTEKLIPAIAPTDATIQTVTWKTDDVTVATVAADGTVTAVAVGEAGITVTTADGAKTATCTVTVTEAPASPQPIISGYKINGYDYAPMWWHDGKLEALSGAAVDPNKMAIAGGDVYIAGNESSVGRIWKNGIMMNLSLGQIGAITASGSDLYIASVQENAGKYEVKVQKNNETPVVWSTYDAYSYINNIRVVNNDVYISVNSGKNVSVLKNKTEISKIENVKNASMCVSPSGDVYVAAQAVVNIQITKASVWKNGVELYELTGGKNYDQKSDIQVVGNDVYVLRCKPSGGREMSLWKNGVQTNLTDKIDADPLGFTVQEGKAYVYSNKEESNGKYTVLQWCDEDDAVTEIFKDLDMSPRAIVFK